MVLRAFGQTVISHQCREIRHLQHSFENPKPPVAYVTYIYDNCGSKMTLLDKTKTVTKATGFGELIDNRAFI